MKTTAVLMAVIVKTAAIIMVIIKATEMMNVMTYTLRDSGWLTTVMTLLLQLAY